MNKNTLTKGHICALLANLMWGLNAPISKTILAEISAVSLTTFRMVGAALAFWTLSLFLKKESVDPKDMLRLFFASIFGIVLNQGMYIFGLSYTSPINASIIVTMSPIITMIVAAIYMKEPITSRKVTGVFLGAVGAITLVVGGSISSSGDDSGGILGDIMVFISAISFSIYLSAFKDIMIKYSPITISKWIFVYASICLIPFSYADIVSINYPSLSSDLILSIAYVVFGATFIAYMSIQTAQAILRPTVVSMYNYAQPIVATIVTIILGLDGFGWMKALAIVLVFSGVYVVNKSKSREELERLSK